MALGLLAPLWWTWAVSQVAYAAYVASGGLEKPILPVQWSTVYGPSLFLGIVVGAAVTALSAPSSVKGWVLFIGSVALATVAIGVVFHAPVEQLRATFVGSGNWLFFAGSALVPGIFHVRRRAV